MPFTDFEKPDHSSVGKGVFEDHGHLLVGVTATGDGEWFDCRGVKDLNIVVAGDGNYTLVLSVSNATEIPADDTHLAEIQFLKKNTQTTFQEDAIPRWAKVRVNFYRNGTIDVSVKRKRYQL